MDKHRGRPKKKVTHDESLSTYQETLGVDSVKQANSIAQRWQAIATVPDEEFTSTRPGASRPGASRNGTQVTGWRVLSPRSNLTRHDRPNTGLIAHPPIYWGV